MWLLSLILTERSRSLQPEKNMTAPCLYFERSGLLWEQRWSKESSSSYAAKSGVFVDRKKGLYSIEVITQPDHMSTACSFRQRAPDPHGCLPSTFWARDIRVQNRRWDIWGSREAKKKNISLGVVDLRERSHGLRLNGFGSSKAIMTASVNFDVAKVARRIGQQRQKRKYLIEELGGSKEHSISLKLIWKKGAIYLTWAWNVLEALKKAMQAFACYFDTTEPATEVDRRTRRTDIW